MLSLLTLLFRQTFRRCFWFVLLGSLALLVIQRTMPVLAPVYQLTLIPLGAMGFLLLGALGHRQGVGSNLSWILCLPLSRKQVLLLQYLSTLAEVVLFGLSLVALIHVADYLFLGRFDSFRMMANEWTRLWFDSGAGWRDWMSQPIAWVVMISLGLSGNLLILAAPNVGYVRETLANWWFTADTARRDQARWITIGTAVVFLAVLRFGHLEPVLWMIVAGGIMSAGALAVALRAVSVPQARRRLWLQMSGATTVVAIFALYGAAFVQLRSASLSQRARAVLFLGALNPQISEGKMTELLEADLGAEQIRSLASFYSRTFLGGKKLGEDRGPIDFKRVVLGKNSYETLLASSELFDPRFVKAAELNGFFDRLNEVDPQAHQKFVPFSWFEVLLSDAEMLHLLHSSNPVALTYALTWARYDRDPDYLQAIETGLLKYPDEVKITAVKTLSVLRGEDLTLTRWLASTNRTYHQVAEVNCGSFSWDNPEKWTEKEATALNLCIRNKVNRRNYELMERVEREGWIRPPLNPWQQALVRAVAKS